MDVRRALIPLPPHPGLWIDAGDRGGINHSMAKLLATKGKPLAQTRFRQENQFRPLHLSLALGSD